MNLCAGVTNIVRILELMSLSKPDANKKIRKNLQVRQDEKATRLYTPPPISLG
jgi:hypothetical protein